MAEKYTSLQKSDQCPDLDLCLLNVRKTHLFTLSDKRYQASRVTFIFPRVDKSGQDDFFNSAQFYKEQFPCTRLILEIEATLLAG